MRIATYNPEKGTVTWHEGNNGEALVRYFGVDNVITTRSSQPEVVLHTHYPAADEDENSLTTIRLPDTILVTGVDF